MAPPPPRSASRYRRRILIGGLAIGLLIYVIGAPIYAGRIEDDLTARVPAELADAGYQGISASFSGQDGTLQCEQPLPDPEAALAAAYDVWGVRAIELDRSCRVSRAPTIATTTTVAADDTTEPSDLVSEDAAAGPTTTESTIAPSTVPDADFDTIADIVASSPELSLLAVLSQEAGFGDRLAGTEPTTLFAPTDAAFDELPADAIARLRDDPELLRRVLDHHAVDDTVPSTDMVSGELVSLDGSPLTIVVAPDTISVDETMVTAPDLMATNGIVHVIDGVLIPGDVDLSQSATQSSVSATFVDGVITLEGVVTTEVERSTLVAAAANGVTAEGVDDQLSVDPAAGLDADNSGRLAALIGAMATNLVAGVSGFDGSALFIRGSYVDEASRDAVLAAAEAVGATAAVEPRPDASEVEAEALETELNEFVAANPILFEPSSSVLLPASQAVIDAVVLRLQQFGGVSIAIEGHTDSDGVPIENLALSQRRAFTVLDALVERGVDPATLTAEGFGSEQPVLIDGVEDKTASRRVEFRVVTAADEA